MKRHSSKGRNAHESPDWQVRRFAVPPILRAERRGRAWLERLLPRAGERLVVPSGVSDDDAWATVLARLAHARGATTELLLRGADSVPGTVFASMLDVCRRLGIPARTLPQDALAEIEAAGALFGHGRWRASPPDTNTAAWDVAWPEVGGEGMLRRVNATSPVLSCAEGEAKVVANKQTEIALRLLRMQVSPADVAGTTGLPKAAVRRLALEENL